MNHWDDDGNLIIEERTMFRQAGWVGQTGRMYAKEEDPAPTEPGGFSPVYTQIATDHGQGWED